MSIFNKKVYLTIIIVALIINTIFATFSTNVIKKQTSNATGPGTIEEQMKLKQLELLQKLEVIKKENGLASQSEIFLHDGIYYAKGEDKGEFMLTGYCACDKCGSGTGYTASGKKVRENHTVASDWKVLPKNTMIILTDATGKDGTNYDGVYQVEDRGGGVKNNHIDIYRPTHELARLVTLKGRCYGHVYLAVAIATESDLK